MGGFPDVDARFDGVEDRASTVVSEGQDSEHASSSAETATADMKAVNSDNGNLDGYAPTFARESFVIFRTLRVRSGANMCRQ